MEYVVRMDDGRTEIAYSGQFGHPHVRSATVSVYPGHFRVRYFEYPDYTGLRSTVEVRFETTAMIAHCDGLVLSSYVEERSLDMKWGTSQIIRDGEVFQAEALLPSPGAEEL